MTSGWEAEPGFTHAHNWPLIAWLKLLRRGHLMVEWPVDWDFLRKIQKMYFSLPKLNRKTNGTIRKCCSRAFQWVVMSVYSDNLKFFGQFLCPALGYRNHHQFWKRRVQILLLCRNHSWSETHCKEELRTRVPKPINTFEEFRCTTR
jgi:hypothetical protein